MDKLKEQVKKTIEEHQMLQPGSRVIAALSGGADSVCLLGILKELEGELGIALRAVHVHHGLRGQEADRDAAFAQAFCGKLSVPCHIIRVDVRSFASVHGMSEEEAGRRLRYEALEREAEAWEAEEGLIRNADGVPFPVRIAAAHHSKDQAETILHNLLRGSGLRGLRGMPWTRGRIIRPLLGADRGDILAWLNAKGYSWVEDSTNNSEDYTRNRIRHHILPEIEREVNPRAAANLLRLGELAGLADAYLEEQGACWAKGYGQQREDGSLFLPDEAFAEGKEKAKAPKIVCMYGLLEILKEMAGSGKDIGFVHVEQTLMLMKKQVGSRVFLPQGMTAKREYGGMSVSRRISVSVPGTENCANAGGRNGGDSSGRPENMDLPAVEIETFSYKKGEEIPKNVYTKWFDCDKIKSMPVVRTRRQGDYMLLEDGSRKSIRRFMIDAKIPREKREQVPLLADGSHVMWIIGYRISGYYKIGPDTSRVMEVRVKTSVNGAS
ncbi:MAG TPA: tRNA lysidine(34) synthetase TilS [Candidatus Enterocloster excrementipullorum]|uniref:tRNA(Ile)-lysidine synthase n=1 Tax=Candidatus Enterocloster excrementipullorum TaxID=2838559 RepID=A0A9D2SI17_9FIRM|nr:tRNA lysidine(34) synthetase TilS [Candidatus Enterocloster excrementipullorum]